ncbi:MAG: NusG domain II-containing protein [Magnetococcus sp. WYHC-3]
MEISLGNHAFESGVPGSWTPGSLVRQFRRATTAADRWLLGGSALLLLWWISAPRPPPGDLLLVHSPLAAPQWLPLTPPREVTVAGRLGPVIIQLEPGRARLREFASARLIGTRTGWITHRGQMAACVPCGVMIQLPGAVGDAAGGETPDAFDALAQ